MAIFGSHSNAATQPKSRLISGPMHARHVGGISITGSTGGNTTLDNYFASTSLEPDEIPSHTYAASGRTEIPRRSFTFTKAVRRPSLSLKRSISRLRSGSGSCASEGHKRSQSDGRPPMTSTRSDPSVTRTIQCQSKPISAPPNMTLDWGEYSSTTRSRSLEFDTIPIPPPKDYPQINSKVSIHSTSAYPAVTGFEQSARKEIPPPLPVRPQRADSGTAIDFDKVSAEERPLSFKEIVAMQEYKDRMELYEKTRNYWANAEHGLAEWTGRTGGPRTVQLRREDNWL